jgi:hypothetical protein
MNADTTTHENEDSIGIFLPAIDHLVVLFLCNLRIYGEEQSRAITKVGAPLELLIRCQRMVVAVAICDRYYEIQRGHSGGQICGDTWVVPSLEVSVGSLGH